MGFYFEGSTGNVGNYDLIEKDKKQHLNLSESAWIVVNQDIKNFYLNEKEESKSGFLNIILQNFYEASCASIELRCANKREEISSILDDIKMNNSKEIKELFLERYIKNYKNSLLERAFSYPKGHGEKFRINIENVLLLKDDINEEDNYYDNIGLYLKALFEEYCEKQNYEREQIFFKDIIDQINLAINNSKKLKIIIREKYNTKTQSYYVRKYYVSPYKIVQDDTKNYNYLVGLSEEILEDGTIGEKHISSFRISRIGRITQMKSMGSFISKESKDKIEQELIQKKAQFMAGELVDVTVRFTQKGLENFKRQLYLRPQLYQCIDKDKSVYVFKCSEVQAINYFFKFGRDIEILGPIELRNKFIKRYESALENYQ